MNKIYEDMDWLPVEKAAEYLSHKTKSNISDIDVLRLCLFGKLKVSVYFSGSVPVARGKLMHATDARLNKAIEGRSDTGVELPVFANKHLIFEPDDYIIRELNGIQDLSMVGEEGWLVDLEYRKRAALPSAPKPNYQLVFLSAPNHEYDYQLYTSQSEAYLQQNNIQPNIHSTDNYAAALSLPEDSFLVIRTQALKEYLLTIESVTKNTLDKELTTKELKSFQIIVAVLAKEAKYNIFKASATAESIAAATEIIGHKLSASNIEEKLKSIPQEIKDSLVK